MKETKRFTVQDRTNFKVFLVKNNLSVKDFAKRCGVTHQYIYKVINGKCNVTPHIITTFEVGGYSINKGKGVNE